MEWAKSFIGCVHYYWSRECKFWEDLSFLKMEIVVDEVIKLVEHDFVLAVIIYNLKIYLLSRRIESAII